MYLDLTVDGGFRVGRDIKVASNRQRALAVEPPGSRSHPVKSIYDTALFQRISILGRVLSFDSVFSPFPSLYSTYIIVNGGTRYRLPAFY